MNISLGFSKWHVVQGGAVVWQQKSHLNKALLNDCHTSPTTRAHSRIFLFSSLWNDFKNWLGRYGRLGKVNNDADLHCPTSALPAQPRRKVAHV